MDWKSQSDFININIHFHSLTVRGEHLIWLLLSVCRGRVIAPSFHFDVTELNLGDVAFGEVHEALIISGPVDPMD